MKNSLFVISAIALLTLLLLSGCGREKIDAAVEKATLEANGRVAMLEDDVRQLTTNVTALFKEKQTLAQQVADAKSSEQAALDQLATLQKTIQQQKTALNEMNAELDACEADVALHEERAENLTKKVTILQGWVEICQETLDNMQ